MTLKQPCETLGDTAVIVDPRIRCSAAAFNSLNRGDSISNGGDHSLAEVYEAVDIEICLGDRLIQW
jgi:hypothetical protein